MKKSNKKKISSYLNRKKYSLNKKIRLKKRNSKKKINKKLKGGYVDIGGGCTLGYSFNYNKPIAGMARVVPINTNCLISNPNCRKC